MKHSWNISVILIALISTHLPAQEEEMQNVFDRENKKYGTSIEKYYREKSLLKTVTPQVLEDVLDANSYMIGPGDGFEIYLWGELENQFDATVNPEGTLIVPTVGEIDVHELTLADAKSRIEQQISKKYLSSEISINLVRLKKFRIYITGEINIPGTYFVQASDRVSDVIEIAEGITDWADNTMIEVRHHDGQTSLIDINRFYFDGSMDDNPYLKAADIIHVPAINIENGYVTVEGLLEITRSIQTEVGEPPDIRIMRENLIGVYSIKKNEELLPFLRRIGALSRSVNLEHIVIERDKREINLNLLKQDADSVQFTLHNRDKIMITPIINKVYVRGEVFRPGEYTYFANLAAKEYVGKAGVLNTGADAENFIIIRHDGGNRLEGGDIILEKGDTIIVPKRTGEKWKDFLVTITPALSIIVTTLILFK